jgi:hypothetical protein
VASISIEAWGLYYTKRFAPWALRWVTTRIGGIGAARRTGQQG